MTNWQIWWLAIRPKTLWVSFAPIIIATSIAYGENQQHWIAAGAALVGALLIQIGTNLANDYFDCVKGADTVERQGPIRLTQSQLVTPATMKYAFILAFTLVIIPGTYLVIRGGIPIAIVGILSIASGILYTGGPFPLGYKGLGDIFSFIFFGPVAVAGTYYVQTLSINITVVLAGIPPGLISMAILTVNNLRDIETDRKVGKNTLAVVFGENFARCEYILCLFTAAIVGIYLLRQQQLAVALMMVFLLLSGTSVRSILTNQGSKLNLTLANTARLLVIYSVFFAMGVVIKI